MEDNAIVTTNTFTTIDIYLVRHKSKINSFAGDRNCNDMNCDTNAVCQYPQDGLPQCVCREGYTGDGYVCQKESGKI